MDEEELISFYSKIDVFHFEYTEELGSLKEYVGAKSLIDGTERYVATTQVNPKDDDEIEALRNLINLDSSMEQRTIAIDVRLLTRKVVNILRYAYHDGKINGIRILSNGKALPKDVIEQFNIEDFNNFMIIADEIENKDAYPNLDLREQKKVCKIESITYQGTEKHSNIHISRMLNKREIKTLVKVLKENNYQQIFVDFYQPAYYSKFLEELKKNGISENIKIVLIGNPLYDEKTCYEGLSNYPIRVRYNTCNELNEFYSREPFTEGVSYYSDIEANGMLDLVHYKELLKMIEEETNHINMKRYSPLEAICYLQDAMKKNNQYQMMLEQKETQDELTSLYSIILRRCGALCYTYGTDSYQRNIARVKDSKYKVDNLALIDPIWEMKQPSNRNSFNRFLVPIDNDLYMSNPEVISIPTSLMMESPDYYAYVNNSNPIAITDPLGYAARLLQVLGWTIPNEQFESVIEEKESYKAALANSYYTDEIPYEIITKAVQAVRRKEREYKNPGEEEIDAREIANNIHTRGNDYYISPAIKLLGPPTSIADVDKYTTNMNNLDRIHFIENSVSATAYVWPRKKKRNETKEQYQKYLVKFYNDNFYKYNKGVKNMEKLEEYMVDEMPVDEIIIYRDINDSGRVFVNSSVLQRFHLPQSKNEILVDNGEMVYEIDGGAATNIINNANNAYSPYVITYLYVQLNEEIIPYDEAISRFNEQGELKNPEDRVIPFDSNASRLDENGNYKNPQDRVIPYQESASVIGKSDRQEIPYNEAVSRFNEQGELKNPGDRVMPFDPNASKFDENGNYKNPQDRVIPYDETLTRFTDKTAEQIIPYDETVSRFNAQGELKNSQDRVIPFNPNVSRLDENGNYKNPGDRVIPYQESASVIGKSDRVIIPFNEEVSRFNAQGELKNPQDRLIPYDESRSVISANEFIPGTNFKSPREQRPDESAESYESYLEGYYDGIFGQAAFENEELDKMIDEYIPGTDFKKPRVRGENETDEDYEAYLETYYDSIFSAPEEESQKRLAA